MDWIDYVMWSALLYLVQMSAAHDHLYLIGEKKTPYFAWTKTKFSPLMWYVDMLRKTEAAQAKANERRKRNRR